MIECTRYDKLQKQKLLLMVKYFIAHCFLRIVLDTQATDMLVFCSLVMSNLMLLYMLDKSENIGFS
jgi:hypothetical protein